MEKTQPHWPAQDSIKEEALTAFFKGLEKRCAVGLSDLNGEYKPCDTMVVWGTIKLTSSQGKACRRLFNRHKRSVIVMERGFVNRDRYHMVGWANQTEKTRDLNSSTPWGLNNRAIFINDSSPSDRWEKLGVELQPRKTNGKNIVICGQRMNDSSVQHCATKYSVGYNAWINNLVGAILSDSRFRKENIVFRYHPLDPPDRPEKNIRIIPDYANNNRFSVSNNSFQEDLEDAKCVLSYNSNTCVEAMIAGVPVFSFDKGSMVWGICNNQLEHIQNPFFPSEEQRRQWAYNLAYTQWTAEEMGEGLPQKHLRLIK